MLSLMNLIETVSAGAAEGCEAPFGRNLAGHAYANGASSILCPIEDALCRLDAARKAAERADCSQVCMPAASLRRHIQHRQGPSLYHGSKISSLKHGIQGYFAIEAGDCNCGTKACTSGDWNCRTKACTSAFESWGHLSRISTLAASPSNKACMCSGAKWRGGMCFRL